MGVAARWAGWDKFAPRGIAGPLAAPDGTRSPITFPGTPLQVRVWLALGADLSADPATWSWTNITAWVRHDPGIEISDGRADESSTVSNATARFTLDNRDGRFTRRNPTSPYYGLLSLQTPIWIEVDPGDGGHTRFTGYVFEWPTRWRGQQASDSIAPVVCGGILRWLQQVPGEALSAQRRAIEAVNPVAYWPMEDPDGSTVGASVVGGMPLRGRSGLIEWAADQPPPGSESLPSLVANADLRAPVSTDGTLTTVAASTTWSGGGTIATAYLSLTLPYAVHFDFRASATPACPLRWSTGRNDYIRVQLTSTTIVVEFLDASAGTFTTLLSAAATIDDEEWHNLMIFVDLRTKPTLDTRLYLDGVEVDTGSTLGLVIQTPTAVVVNPRSEPSITESILSVGHVAIIGPPSGITDIDDLADYLVPLLYPAFEAHNGEQAHVRIARVCDQLGVRFTTQAAESEVMGPQPTATGIDILREAEATDMGVLYEVDWGLGYQALSERYNAAVRMTLDIDSGHLAIEPEIADDDQRVRNKWTAESETASATFAEASGPLGTAAIGVWEESASVNPQDDRLMDHATWRTHLSLVDEDRWPAVAMRLHATPDLIETWTELPYGARIKITNLPTQVPPDAVGAVIEGREEHIDQVSWDVALATSPASVYDVGVYETSRYDTAGSETTADFIAGTDTSLTVATTLGEVWITGTVDFNIRVSGVVLHVTEITSATSPQTFTVDQAPVNGVVKTIPTGSSVGLANPGRYAL